jgi:hypothetical protein
MCNKFLPYHFNAVDVTISLSCQLIMHDYVTLRKSGLCAELLKVCSLLQAQWLRCNYNPNPPYNLLLCSCNWWQIENAYFFAGKGFNVNGK